MKIHFEDKAGEKLANLLLEIDTLIVSGDIKVGATGLSPDSARYCKHFQINGFGIEQWFIDKGLKL